MIRETESTVGRFQTAIANCYQTVGPGCCNGGGGSELVTVANTTPIPVTGSLSVAFPSTPIAITSSAGLIGVTGSLNVTALNPVTITGLVNITSSGTLDITNSTGPLEVTIANLTLPVQITNIAALEITSGQLNVAIRAPAAATNEILMATPYPTVQMDFFNGIDSNTSNSRYISGAAITAYNGLLSVSSNGVSGTAYLESQRIQAYRVGQSMQTRIGAQFITSNITGLAYAGPINAESGCAVGYKNNQFGFFRRAGGTRQINLLQITGASIPLTGYTITLNGVSTVVTVGGGHAISVADQLASFNWAPNVTGIDGLGYTVMASAGISSSVTSHAHAYFLANAAEPKSGTFSSSITNGAGTYSSTFDLIVSGAVPTTDTFITQGAWNVDPLDGNLHSGIQSAFVLDPLTGNLYNIAYQAVGYGMNVLQVMDPDLGVWVTTHREKNTPATFNPRTPLQFYAQGQNAAINGTSASAFIDGDFQLLGPTYSVSRLVTKLNLALNTWYNVFTIRNDQVFNGRANYKLVNLTNLTFYANPTGGSPQYHRYLIRLVKNAVVSNTSIFYSVASNKSIVSADYTGEFVTQSGSEQIADFAGSTQNSMQITFTKNQFIINPGDFLTLVFQGSISGTPDYEIGASLSWIEN